jgi:signal transduction histidine kinase
VALEDRVQVVVSDSGIGLTSEDRANLFTKFFRGSNRVVAESRGTGLGLVIAKAILQAHGASIDVDSEPGKGTRFRVIFPLGAPLSDRSQV